MKQFRKENLLKEQKVGKSSLYTLNMDNDIVYYYIALSNHLRLSKLAQRTVKMIKESVGKHIKFYSIVVFGSYAAQEQKKESDLDVAVFIEIKGLKKEIQRALDSVELKSVVKLDGHVITKDEFLEMLRVEEENLGKQIARKHLVAYNHQIFYTIMQEGIKNGFRI
jgi:predicted nucleotidyltransferase